MGHQCSAYQNLHKRKIKMNNNLIISGVHLDLTDAIKNVVREKMEKLFRHEEEIQRIRVELEHNQHKTHNDDFIAKGFIDIHGPNIMVAASSDNLYKSIDILVDKLDRKLRRRARIGRVKRKESHHNGAVSQMA